MTKGKVYLEENANKVRLLVNFWLKWEFGVGFEEVLRLFFTPQICPALAPNSLPYIPKEAYKKLIPQNPTNFFHIEKQKTK